ncbi:hypothetical protein B5P44_00215 [Mycobacterium sp. CBMA 213]|uniref:Uncharacterized protein n=1 Tax=Mycolicibacterium sp. CBMA 213 TaxID=1968788 RepID=A0A343VR21_9MYCO|nr:MULTISPECIES: hypothetical protein [unclassified Mycolicibacterium]AVN58345.1 hypothetical protein B5P44_p00050 [Mycolicibacterium sp. CBMA 213]MUL61009.1 hypothetical protein [Mycolicibacterium sp. CBMA 335]MUM03246.1 hypothetical protein [Mycolicibacterium sp. CBMA 213]
MSSWTLEVESAEYGLIPTMNVTAVSKCGRVERFAVSLWPAGWRILQRDLNIPASVRREAIQLAKQLAGHWWGLT